MDRRLTTIVAADLVGFSRLMAADEEGVITRLRAARAEVIDPAVARASGRIIKTMGDGLLIEFPSPAVAVDTVIAVQDAMAARETGADDQRLRFRIGVNTGEVVVDGDDVLGDAVNIAARLETLAAPGGVCVSAAVRAGLDGLDARLTPLGPQAVKNIPTPVDVWRVEIEGVSAPPPEMGARASVAVLPFDVMARDPDLEFVADGIVEDVTTELSRFRWLFVIARNSAFAYRGAGKDVREIAQELGVRYVVEGSVRGARDRLRLTAQLIDAETGAHVWAERWDRSMEDLFAVQDELTSHIVAGVEPEIGAHERSLARAKPTESMTAWDLCQRGYAEYAVLTPASLARAEGHWRRAISLDPSFGLPFALLARQRYYVVISGAAPDPQAVVAEGLTLANKALELDPRSDAAYVATALLLVSAGRAEDALRAARKGLSLNPNNALLCYASGMSSMHLGQVETALEALTAARRLSPVDPIYWAFLTVAAGGLMLRDGAGDGARAEEMLRESMALENTGWHTFVCAACLAMRDGRADEARQRLTAAMTLAPNLTAGAFRRAIGAPASKALAGELDALIAMGLPE